MSHHLESKSSTSKKCCKHESDRMELFDEKKTVYNTKQATVEVTVKLKRHKSSSTKVPDPHAPYRKGSWGDLLSKNRAVEFQIAEKEDSLHSSKRKPSKCTFPETCHSSKSNCLKIPITEELYLETHTHLGGQKQQEVKKTRVPSAKFTLIQENEFLRNEIADLRREVEKIKSRKKIEKEVKVPAKLDDKLVPEQQSILPIIPMKKISSKKIAETQTDGRPSVKIDNHKEPNLMDKSLEMENAALRREAMMLEAEMNKAKQEQQDYVTTIKELYQLAEILKNENQVLAISHEEKQKIHERLVDALNENHMLKQHMDVLMVKRDENERAPNDRVSKIRNVIRDVKSTIAEEISGLEKLRKSSIAGKRDSSKFDFNVEDVSALLNDTHSSEIQRILSTKDLPPPTVPFSEDRSSTQYYGVPNPSPKGSRYRPSPPPHEMEFSPRVSTPVFAAPPMRGSADMRLGNADKGQFRLETDHGAISPGDAQLRGEQSHLYRIDSCQSFMPLQVDMVHDDEPISTSDYRSTTSSPSSPNRNRNRLPPY